jgi:hypothetical protein
MDKIKTLAELELEDECNTDKTHKAVTTTIKRCAPRTVPQSRIKGFRPLWAQKLTKLEKGDKACFKLTEPT